MPNRNRTSTLAPLANGVPSVIKPTPIDELNPPPFGCPVFGAPVACSRVVPCTVILLVPEPQGGRSTVTTTSVEVLGRRSAIPLAAGNVAMFSNRKRKRVRLPPVLFVYVRRRSMVPNVLLFGASEVLSRTLFGAAPATEQVSSRVRGVPVPVKTGALKFSGPGAPSRCPSPAEVPFVSTNIKSAALLSVSCRNPSVGVPPKGGLVTVKPEANRTKLWSIGKVPLTGE